MQISIDISINIVYKAILRAGHETSSNEDFRILFIQDGDEENSAVRRKLRAN